MKLTALTICHRQMVFLLSVLSSLWLESVRSNYLLNRTQLVIRVKKLLVPSLPSNKDGLEWLFNAVQVDPWLWFYCTAVFHRFSTWKVTYISHQVMSPSALLGNEHVLRIAGYETKVSSTGVEKRQFNLCAIQSRLKKRESFSILLLFAAFIRSPISAAFFILSFTSYLY